MRAITIILFFVLLAQQAFAQVKTEETKLVEGVTNLLISDFEKNKNLKENRIKRKEELFQKNKDFLVEKWTLNKYKVIQDAKLSPSGQYVYCRALNKRDFFLIVIEVKTGKVIFEKEVKIQPDYQNFSTFRIAENEHIVYHIRKSSRRQQTLFIDSYNFKENKLVDSKVYEIGINSRLKFEHQFGDTKYVLLNNDSLFIYNLDKGELIKAYEFPYKNHLWTRIGISKNGEYIIIFDEVKGNQNIFEIRKTSDFSIVKNISEDFQFPPKKYKSPTVYFSDDYTQAIISSGGGRRLNHKLFVLDMKTNKILSDWKINYGGNKINLESVYFTRYSELFDDHAFKTIFSFNHGENILFNIKTDEELATFKGKDISKSNNHLLALSGFYYGDGGENEIFIYDLSKIIDLPKYKAHSALEELLGNKFGLSLSESILFKLVPFKEKITLKLEGFKEIKPKDEFETTNMYELRAKKSKRAVFNVLITEWENYYNKNDSNGISFQLDSLGSYNADKQEYQVYAMGVEALIQIPLQEAKSFKENLWNKSKVNARIIYKGDNQVPLITDLTISAGEKVYTIELNKQPLIELFRLHTILDF